MSENKYNEFQMRVRLSQSIDSRGNYSMWIYINDDLKKIIPLARGLSDKDMFNLCNYLKNEVGARILSLLENPAQENRELSYDEIKINKTIDTFSIYGPRLSIRRIRNQSTSKIERREE